MEPVPGVKTVGNRASHLPGRSKRNSRCGKLNNARHKVPSPSAEILPGVIWGRHDCLFTPAYWATQAFHHMDELNTAPIRMGETLVEEVTACLLGGHGIPSETAKAAFAAVRDSCVLNARSPSECQLRRILSRPLIVGDRTRRYRFPKVKARYIARAVQTIRAGDFSFGPHRPFRDALTAIDGIGWKTASWITRNWHDSDEVAVLDVHILRAGIIMGLFEFDSNVARDYLALERRFLQFAVAIGVRASRLDALMWRQMKGAGPIANRLAVKALQRADKSPNLIHAA